MEERGNIAERNPTRSTWDISQAPRQWLTKSLRETRELTEIFQDIPEDKPDLQSYWYIHLKLGQEKEKALPEFRTLGMGQKSRVTQKSGIQAVKQRNQSQFRNLVIVF